MGLLSGGVSDVIGVDFGWGDKAKHQKKYYKKELRAINKGSSDMLAHALFGQQQALGATQEGFGEAIGLASDSAQGAKRQSAVALQQGLGEAKNQMANTGGSFAGSANVGLQRAFLSDYQNNLKNIGDMLSQRTSGLRAQETGMEAQLHASAPGAQVAQVKMNALQKLFSGMRGEGAPPTAGAEMVQTGMDLWGAFAGAFTGGGGGGGG